MNALDDPGPAFCLSAAEHYYLLPFTKTQLMKIEWPPHMRQILALCNVPFRFLARDQVTDWLNNVLFPYGRMNATIHYLGK